MSVTLCRKDINKISFRKIFGFPNSTSFISSLSRAGPGRVRRRVSLRNFRCGVFKDVWFLGQASGGREKVSASRPIETLNCPLFVSRLFKGRSFGDPSTDRQLWVRDGMSRDGASSVPRNPPSPSDVSVPFSY